MTKTETAAQIDLDKLEALAKAVEGVEFHAEGFEQIEGKGQFYGGLIMSSDGETIVAQCVLKHWANFIVAANPATILALIPQLRAQLPAKAVAYELPEALSEVRAKFRGEWDYAESGGNYYTAQQVMAAFEAGRDALARQQPAASGAGEVAASIDTPEFRDLLQDVEVASPDRYDGAHMLAPYETARAAFIAHIDAQLARQRQAEPVGQVEGWEVGLQVLRSHCEAVAAIRNPELKPIPLYAAAPAAPHAQAEPVYQVQILGETVWRDATEEAYHTFMPVRRRILYAAPVPQEAEQAAPAAVTMQPVDEWALPSPTIIPLPKPEAMISHFDGGDEYPVFNRNHMHSFARAYARAALTQPAAPAVTFEQAWAKYEAKGYRYGQDALEQVRFGWRIACEFFQPAAPAVTDAARDVLADAKDAERLRWLIEDHDDADVRQIARDLAQRLGTSSYFAITRDIDAAMRAQSKE